MNKRKKKNGISPQIWTAIITTAGVIIVAVFAFPPFQRLFDPTPSSTAISTDTPAPTITFTLQPDTPTPTASFTETFTPTSTLTLTSIPPSATFTLESGLPTGMQVIVTANPSSGKKPLKVKIDARDSYLRAPNGDIFYCRDGACKYTWYLTLPGGQPVLQAEKKGFIEFTFDKRGTYYINVRVCHGSDKPTCESGGAPIIVE